LFKKVFESYGGRKMEPGEKVALKIDEFRTLVDDTGILINDQLSEKEIPIFFNHGLMLHKNELESD